MQFHVGPFVYNAYLVRGHITHQGRQCLGLCQHEERRVLVSDRLDPVEQFQVLCHELWHAWHHRFATDDAGDEPLADLVGIAMTQLATDLYGAVPRLREHGLDYLPEGDAVKPLTPEPPLTPSLTYLSRDEAAGDAPRPPTYRVRVFEPPAGRLPPSPPA